MKNFIWTLAFSIGILTSGLAQTNWKPIKGTVTFKIKNAGFTANGHFGGFVGTLLFDPAMLSQSQLTASVETGTVDTGIGARDNHLKKEEYFDVANFPRITMKSTQLERQSDNAYVGTFALTIKGTTRTVKVPFTFTQANGMATFTGSFVINRLDYKLGSSSLVLSDNATISISVQARSASAAVVTN